MKAPILLAIGALAAASLACNLNIDLPNISTINPGPIETLTVVCRPNPRCSIPFRGVDDVSIRPLLSVVGEVFPALWLPIARSAPAWSGLVRETEASGFPRLSIDE